MSKCNSSDSKAGEINLAESNQFTLKGDDEIYEIYSSPRPDSYKLNVESNKKINTRSSSRRSIKISNLTNFSFRKYNSDDQEMKNEDKINITDSNNFKKVNIIPVQGKSNSIVKITLTKTKKNSNKKTNESNKNLFPSNEIKEEINNIIKNKNEQIANLNNEQNTIIETTNQNQVEKSDSNSNENINDKELENKIDKNSIGEEKSENRSIEPSLELDFEYDSKESEKRSLTYENNNMNNEIPFDNKISVEKEIPINELNLSNNSNEKNESNKEDNNKESEIVTEPMREVIEENENIQNSKINEPKSNIDNNINELNENNMGEKEENNNYINDLNKLNNKDKNEIDKIDKDNKKKELSITQEAPFQNNNNLNNEITTGNKNENSKEIEINDINFQNAAMDIDSEVENFHKEKVQNESEDENANASANSNIKDDIKTSLTNKINNNNNNIENNNLYENKVKNVSMNNEIYIECKNFLTQIFDYETIKKGKKFTSNFQIDINKDQKIEEKFHEKEKNSYKNNEENEEKMLVETEKVCCEEEKTEIKKEENIEEKIEEKKKENLGEEEKKEKEISDDIHCDGKLNETSKILEQNESCQSEEKEKEKEIKKQKEEEKKKENINLESQSKNMAILTEKNKNNNIDIFEIIEIKEEDIEIKDEKSECKIKKDKEEEKGIKKEMEKDIKKEKSNELNVKEEDLDVCDKKEEKINMNIFDKDFFEKMKQQIKNEIYDDLINNGPLSPKSKSKQKKLKKESDEKNESDSSEEDENKSKNKIKNKEKEKDKTLLGKKRERSHLFEIDNSIKINYISDIIKTSEIYFDKDKNNNLDNNEGVNENSDSGNNKVDETILKLLESCAFKCLYEKIISKSFNNDNDLDRKIREIIKTKGFSNVVATLKYYKKNQILSSKVKEKINNNEPESDKKSEKESKKNPKEFHYNLLNDFYYRYKCINMKNNIQKYVCCAKDCNGLAELNLDEKKFGIIQDHSISPKFHIKFNDDKPIKFMKKRKLEEMHIKKNDNNDKFHMEWFK